MEDGLDGPTGPRQSVGVPARAALVALVAALAVVWGEGRAAAEAEAPRIAALEAELEALAGGPASDVAPDEIRRARELLAQARAAEAAGESRVAEGLLGAIPLQLRLVREIVAAAELEARAAAAERESLEAERRAREARVAVDRLLERLVALSIGDPFE